VTDTAIRAIAVMMFCRSSLIYFIGCNRFPAFSSSNIPFQFRRKFHLANPARIKNFPSTRGASVTSGYRAKKFLPVLQKRTKHGFPEFPIPISWFLDVLHNDDFLDVLPNDDRFLNYMSIEDYKSSCFERGDELCTKVYYNNYRRLVTVLPLYTDHDQKVVPIPCIIDTGAPATLVLCAGAMAALKQKNLLIEDFSMRAAGIIKKNGREIVNPSIMQLPEPFESNKSIKDVRFNILGLHGLEDLKFIIKF